MLATFRKWIQENSDKYLIIEKADDVRRAKQEGKLGISFDLEGGKAVDDLPALIEPYYALGVRWMLIAYNKNNALGGGCEDDDSGLTDFGRSVIDEMERVGMVVDLSHTGDRTANDIFEYSSQPVNYSHSNPNSVYEHERNISDEMIRKCAQSGGVVNLNGIGFFLGDNDNSTENFLRHVDHVANVAGPEHVGMGLDYVFDQSQIKAYVAAHPDIFPPEKGYDKGVRMVEPERIPEIVEGLLNMGWSDENVLGFLGGNNLRVAEKVWK